MWLLVKRKVPFVEFVLGGHFSLKAKQFVESFVATKLGTVDIAYNVACSLGCNLHGMYGYMTPVKMHPPGPRSQNLLDTTDRFPSTWPFLQGGQTLSRLQLSRTKDFYMATSPLRLQIPTSQSLPLRHSCDVNSQTLHFHHPNM
jgi:hypothetical protein